MFLTRLRHEYHRVPGDEAISGAFLLGLFFRLTGGIPPFWRGL
ncbi:hypothetical protein QUF80_09370 [Desulfococcaceae bacterium HSG8]|nr:hypothetical protein [Desulfococcaceae bacterium HSG8]